MVIFHQEVMMGLERQITGIFFYFILQISGLLYSLEDIGPFVGLTFNSKLL